MRMIASRRRRAGDWSDLFAKVEARLSDAALSDVAWRP
jgi:hypothetical protein